MNVVEARPTRALSPARAYFQQFAFIVLFVAGLLPSFGQTNFPIQLEENVRLLGLLEHFGLTESSGLTASRRYTNVFWSHSDDSFQFIFAIDKQGGHIGAFEVQGANLIDWEAISTDGSGNLYLADIGSDGMARTHSAIHRVEEPDPFDEWGRAVVEKTWYIRYPGPRVDAESFFVFNGYGYVITKPLLIGAVSMYRFPLGDDDEYVLEFVASIPAADAVADAALSPDAQRLALVTNEGVEVYFINGNPANVAQSRRVDTEFENNQMEGITFAPEGLLVTAESREVFLFHAPELRGAPEITRPLFSQTAFIGENVLFTVAATGSPGFTYQWFFNRRPIPGATNSSLTITNVTAANAGMYQVVVTNPNGSTYSTAILTVIERTAKIRITEVMSDPGGGALPKSDWWELTNFGTNAVDLTGWMFSDAGGDLEDAVVITNVTIAPSESIIFVENLTRAQFLAWWGPDRIAPGTQIITYVGVRFAADGDSLRLWAPGTTSENAVYEQVTFGAAESGVSFGFDPDTGVFGELSRINVNGAFPSVDGLNVGSPGRIRGGPPPAQTADLRITEVMSNPGATNAFAKSDWWELTSFDTNVVDLSGWRFNDATGGIEDAFVIPGGTRISPGESIIFVEDLTPSEFLAWWGTNVPAGTQIITYNDIGLSENGDSLRLWTTNIAEVYTEVTFVAAQPGVSFKYNPDTGLFGEPSQVGVHGAFFSADVLDVGSPGRIRGGGGPGPGDQPDLRITEVMSSPGATNVFAKADWWELTSFHTNLVDLAGWRFNDNTGGPSDGFIIPNGVTISPGESILFVEDLSAPDFAAWWGTNLLSGTKIVTFTGDGLSFDAAGDSVRLWTTDTNEVFRQATFTAATRGVSFGYDPETGTFGEPSDEGVDGAFRSTDALDVGSPGRIRNPIPPVDTIDVRITEVMSDEVSANVEDWWELTSFDSAPVDLSGWRFNDSTGGLEDAFTIPNGVVIQPGESIIFVEDLSPEEFIAWWGANNIPPGTQIITYTTNQIGFADDGDAIRLWTNGVTDPSAVFTNVTFGVAQPGVSFTYNPDTQIFGEPSQQGVNGAVFAAAGPEVGSPGRIRGESIDLPAVRITEVMSSPSTNTLIASDWWELTNFDSEVLELSGWRFNDNTGDASDGFIIPDGVTIQPGESIIFVEDLTPDEFRTWWGEANLSPTLQIITYTGVGFSAENGDQLRLWTQDTNSILTQVAFGQADSGVTFGYDPDTQVFGEKSAPGVHGAFGAATGPDVGSPGRIRNDSEARLQFTSEGVRVDLHAPADHVYSVDHTEDLVNGPWAPTGTTIQGTNSVVLERNVDGEMRFYRLRKL
ncbi:MAG TPA: lamin tail domain-containing protein [Verrucomicrobiae bacterium]